MDTYNKVKEMYILNVSSITVRNHTHTIHTKFKIKYMMEEKENQKVIALLF